jgi:hypothetical protein
MVQLCRMQVKSSCELLVSQFWRVVPAKLPRDMQEVERDRSSLSDFQGDAAQVQRDRRHFRINKLQEMSPAHVLNV